jgi:photosystem II stability/assembly factor-like uncharacterized protein
MLSTLLTLILGLSPGPLPAQEPDAPEAETQAQETEGEEETKPRINSGLLSTFKWRPIGPALMSGRIADIAIHPTEPNTWYVAAGSGNLWKTTNAGTTFKPIFENYGSYSIGCVTIDPTNHDRIWVGTGENVGGRHVGYGDGIYLSEDGGKSFRNMGLKESEHLSVILVDPTDQDTIYVASQGPLWSTGGERGLYRSQDGGETWEQVLAGGPWTGVTDVVMDPRDPKVLYAATHQRARTVWAVINGGPETGIHKSTDGGDTWRELKTGLPGADMGKIGLALAPEDPDRIYATIELAGPSGGFWVSEDAGMSWSKTSDYASGGTGPHYYQEIWADPHHPGTVYQANVRLGRTRDFGETWESVSKSSKHVDNHAVAFHPTDPDFLLVGCDGGLYVSHDRGENYRYFPNLSLTQFYKVDVDYDWPIYHVVGGTQDNNTQYGPSRTLNRQGVRNDDWRVIIGGDGHDNAIDPTNPDIIYGESQQGYIRRFDRRTGQSTDIRPQPGPGEDNFRFNWDSPILISPHDPKRIWFGSNVLHRSDDRGESWTTVSPDLSYQRDRLKLKVMDRYWGLDALWDLRAMSKYGNITSISESPQVEGLVYIGTDDGRVQVTEDGGATWRAEDVIGDVPTTSFVNDIKADRFDPDTVYVCLDNHKEGDFAPYVLKSTDRGRTWTSIASDLPEKHLIWRIEQDHEAPGLLFLGTEFGVFTSLDAGGSWHKLKSGMPKIPVRDLAIQMRENDLVAATFGRGFYVLDDYSNMRVLSEELLEEEIVLLPVKDAQVYVVTDMLGGRVGSQGDQYFSTPNPDFGAVIRYHVAEGLKTSKAEREKAEKEADTEDEGVPYPGWDVLAEERKEERPMVVFEIRDAAGALVRRLDGSSGKGMHRLVWDLCWTGTGTGSGGRGPLVEAGEYTAQAVRMQDGENVAWGAPVSIGVYDLLDPAIPSMPRGELRDWLDEVGELDNVVSASLRLLDDAIDDVGSMKNAVRDGRVAPLELGDRVRAVELELQDMRRAIAGDDLRTRYHHEGAPSIQGRLRNARWGGSSIHGPTTTMRQQVDIARGEFTTLHGELKTMLEETVPALKAELDAAGVGWTSGRALPDLPE